MNPNVYVPLHSVPLACGPFLSPSFDQIEYYLQLPPEREFQYGLYDGRVLSPRLSAARVWGDSMILQHIHDGDLVIFRRTEENEEVRSGAIAVIEKLGEDPGAGAWSLKRLVIKRPVSTGRNEFGDEIRWDDPQIELHSENPTMKARELDPLGRYRIHGHFRRIVPPDQLRIISAEDLPSRRGAARRNRDLL